MNSPKRPLVPREEIDRFVLGLVASLPAAIQEALAGVEIIIQDTPLDAGGDELPQDRLGEYAGESVASRSERFYPERIVIYTANIERDVRDREEFLDELEITLLHEIGHHLGLDEEELEEWGFG